MSEEKRSAGRRVLSREELQEITAKAGTLAYVPPQPRGLDRFGEPINRRELLAYATAASLALFAVAGAVTMTSPNSTDQLVGVIDPNGKVIPGGFMYPRFKAGEFGGVFTAEKKYNEYSLTDPPALNSTGRFYIARINRDPATDEEFDPEAHPTKGIIAIYQVCTHLGCLIPYQTAENRFICPCHGSTFERNTKYVRGPAPRNLDQFQVNVQADGTILIDTGKKITGAVHS